jgi:hypothetical protein
MPDSNPPAADYGNIYLRPGLIVRHPGDPTKIGIVVGVHASDDDNTQGRVNVAWIDTTTSVSPVHKLECLTQILAPNVDRTIHKRSGSVSSDNTLVAFFYLLMRDVVPSGKLEDIMHDLQSGDPASFSFSNGWLATYAQDLVARLTGKTNETDDE